MAKTEVIPPKAVWVGVGLDLLRWIFADDDTCRLVSNGAIVKV